jgi:hypothetical protein
MSADQPLATQGPLCDKCNSEVFAKVANPPFQAYALKPTGSRKRTMCSYCGIEPATHRYVPMRIRPTEEQADEQATN